MTVGEKIKKVRTEKGLTQKRLGELCGMLEPNIRAYELGKANPKIETIAKIAAALQVSVLDLREDLTFGERWDNEESAFDSVFSIIGDIYGKVDFILDRKQDESGGNDGYILVSKDEERFILPLDDVDAIRDAARAVIESQVENLKTPVNTPELLEKVEKDMAWTIEYRQTDEYLGILAQKRQKKPPE